MIGRKVSRNGIDRVLVVVLGLMLGGGVTACGRGDLTAPTGRQVSGVARTYTDPCVHQEFCGSLDPTQPPRYPCTRCYVATPPMGTSMLGRINNLFNTRLRNTSECIALRDSFNEWVSQGFVYEFNNPNTDPTQTTVMGQTLYVYGATPDGSMFINSNTTNSAIHPLTYAGDGQLLNTVIHEVAHEYYGIGENDINYWGRTVAQTAANCVLP